MKRKVLKKALVGALALSTIFSAAFMTGCGEEPIVTEEMKQEDFIRSIGGVSDTYKGDVSVDAYETTDDAMKAYLEMEIAGNNGILVVDVTNHGKLTATEVEALNLPHSMRNTVAEVEKLKVLYKETAISSTAGAPVSNQKTWVYIIKLNNDTYKYYIPIPMTGLTINRGYYNSVTNANHYKNCTLDTKITLNQTTTAPAQGTVSVSIDYMQRIEYTADKIHLYQSTTMQSGNEMEVYDLEAYIEQSPNTQGELETTCYVRNGEYMVEWVRNPLNAIGFNNLAELMPFYNPYMDYTYFTKTDYGFALDATNAKNYLNNSMNGVLRFIGQISDTSSIDMFAKYYVYNGAIAGMRMDLSVLTATQQASSNTTAYMETSITQVGTTKVEKPLMR